MKKVVILLLLALFVVPLSVSAQEPARTPEPETPADNTCFKEGATCTTEWEWVCGWYMARWEVNRENFVVPVWCSSLLPPSETTDGGTEVPATPLVCEELDFYVVSEETFIPGTRCANQTYGFDDYYSDGSYNFLYYFGDYGSGCPAAPGTHTFYGGPGEMTYTLWSFPPYNVTAPYLCTYQIIP